MNKHHEFSHFQCCGPLALKTSSPFMLEMAGAEGRLANSKSSSSSLGEVAAEVTVVRVLDVDLGRVDEVMT